MSAPSNDESSGNDAQAGAQNIQATTEAWSNHALIIANVLPWVVYFVETMLNGVSYALTPYVTSAFALPHAHRRYLEQCYRWRYQSYLSEETGHLRSFTGLPLLCLHRSCWIEHAGCVQQCRSLRSGYDIPTCWQQWHPVYHVRLRHRYYVPARSRPGTSYRLLIYSHHLLAARPASPFNAPMEPLK